MTEEINTRQTAQNESSMVSPGQAGYTGDALGSAEKTTPRFNRYLYENLVTNVETQIEFWNRMAGRESNHQAALALRLKAEGLGYTLRLLDAFEPEFRELTDNASHRTAKGIA